MEFREAVRFGRRWWWLLLLGPLIAGAVAFIWSALQPAAYRAEATLLVNAVGAPGTLGTDAPRGGQELARTYQELVLTWPVLEPAMQALELAVDFEALRDRVEAEAIAGTQLLRITASDPRAQRAADLANAVASSFVTYIGQQQADGIRAGQAELTRQLENTQAQIEDVENQIRDREDGSSSPNPGNEPSLISLSDARDELLETRSGLLNRRQEIDFSAVAAANHVAVVVDAQPPASPSSPRPLFATLVGAFAGLLVVVGALALVEYLTGEERG